MPRRRVSAVPSYLNRADQLTETVLLPCNGWIKLYDKIMTSDTQRFPTIEICTWSRIMNSVTELKTRTCYDTYFMLWPKFRSSLCVHCTKIARQWYRSKLQRHWQKEIQNKGHCRLFSNKTGKKMCSWLNQDFLTCTCVCRDIFKPHIWNVFYSDFRSMKIIPFKIGKHTVQYMAV